MQACCLHHPNDRLLTDSSFAWSLLSSFAALTAALRSSALENLFSQAFYLSLEHSFLFGACRTYLQEQQVGKKPSSGYRATGSAAILMDDIDGQMARGQPSSWEPRRWDRPSTFRRCGRVTWRSPSTRRPRRPSRCRLSACGARGRADIRGAAAGADTGATELTLSASGRRRWCRWRSVAQAAAICNSGARFAGSDGRDEQQPSRKALDWAAAGRGDCHEGTFHGFRCERRRERYDSPDAAAAAAADVRVNAQVRGRCRHVV